MNALNEIRLYLKLRPDIARLRKLFAMHISVNVALQIGLTLLHMGNILSSVVPPARKPLAMALLGAGNVLVSALAHYSNPDGTAAELPYKP